MTLALIVLSLLVLGEAFVIYGLLNRVLLQAKVAPLEAPKLFHVEPEETPREIERRKLFSVDVPS